MVVVAAEVVAGAAAAGVAAAALVAAEVAAAAGSEASGLAAAGSAASGLAAAATAAGAGAGGTGMAGVAAGLGERAACAKSRERRRCDGWRIISSLPQLSDEPGVDRHFANAHKTSLRRPVLIASAG